MTRRFALLVTAWIAVSCGGGSQATPALPSPAPVTTPAPTTRPKAMASTTATTTPSPKAAHRLAVAFLVDRSASMGGPRLAAARKAIVAALSGLSKDDDLFEVLAFDAKATVVLSLRPVDAGEASKALSAMKTGAGTDFYDALDLVHADLSPASATTRHVVLITDGRATNPGIPSAVAALADDGIGLTTVGIADGVDAPQLAALAKRGGGRSYALADATTLQATLVKEMSLLAP